MGERVYFVLDDGQPYVRVARKLGALIAWKLVLQVQNDSTMHLIEVQWHDGVTNQTVGTIAPQETTAFAANVVDWLTLQRAPNTPGVVVSGWYQILAAAPQ
jgi:hypothetical protein